MIKIEVEGSELALQNSNGDVAIIPKKYRREAEDMLKEGCYDCLDDLISTLPGASNYAQDGTLITDPPPVNQNNPVNLSPVDIVADKNTKQDLPFYSDLSEEEKRMMPQDNVIGRGIRHKAREGKGLDGQDMVDFTKGMMFGAFNNAGQILQTPQSLMVEGIEQARGNAYDYNVALPNIGSYDSNQRVPSDTFLKDEPGAIQFAGDMLLDPTAAVGGALGALSKTSKASKATRLVDDIIPEGKASKVISPDPDKELLKAMPEEGVVKELQKDDYGNTNAEFQKTLNVDKVLDVDNVNIEKVSDQLNKKYNLDLYGGKQDFKPMKPEDIQDALELKYKDKTAKIIKKISLDDLPTVDENFKFVSKPKNKSSERFNLDEEYFTNLKEKYRKEFEKVIGVEDKTTRPNNTDKAEDFETNYSEKDLGLYVKFKEAENLETLEMIRSKKLEKINKAFIDKHKLDSNFSKEEEILIDSYTRGYDTQINNRYDHLKGSNVQTNFYNKMVAPKLEAVIKKNQLKAEEIFKRSLGNHKTVIERNGKLIEGRFNDLQVGDIYNPDSFTSAALEEGNYNGSSARELEIVAPKGQSVLFPNSSGVKNYEQELEIILPQKLKYEVIEKNGNNIKTKIINPYVLLPLIAGPGAAEMLNE